MTTTAATARIPPASTTVSEMSQAEPMVRSNFFLPKQLVEKLRALANKHGTPQAEHVRRAIEEYLAK